MNRCFPSLRQLARARRAAFTLIELLTVIAIILVLAGLLLHIAGTANYKASVSRATTEVKAMETALESYKADNGAYPRVMAMSPTTASTSDALNAQSDVDPGSGTSKSNYQGASETLYQALSGLTAVSGTTQTYGGKRYMEFKPGQLGDASGSAYTSPSATTVIVDPFGLIYGYSTINTWAVEQGKNSSTYGYNPTFDLWSTAGYGTGGKSYPNAATGTACNPFWAKNW